MVVEGYNGLKNTDLSHPVLTQIAQRHAVTPAQVVLRWHLHHDIVILPRSSRRERIAANLDLEHLSGMCGRCQVALRERTLWRGLGCRGVRQLCPVPCCAPGESRCHDPFGTTSRHGVILITVISLS